MPGCGLSLILWNMPRISAVALTGDTLQPPRPATRAEDQCAEPQLVVALSGAKFAVRASMPGALTAPPPSRTKNPRFLRASTKPCACNWS